MAFANDVSYDNSNVRRRGVITFCINCNYLFYTEFVDKNALYNTVGLLTHKHTIVCFPTDNNTAK